jgi:predicted transcriptional regulator
MGCIEPDGSLSVTARVLLEKLVETPLRMTEITVLLKVPGFMVRANLRELGEAGLVREHEGRYRITEGGRGRL